MSRPDKSRGRRLRVTGGVPCMGDLLMLIAALLLILLPPYVADALAGAQAGADPQRAPIAGSADTPVASAGH